jgi:hypothetical protein
MCEEGPVVQGVPSKPDETQQIHILLLLGCLPERIS